MATPFLNLFVVCNCTIPQPSALLACRNATTFPNGSSLSSVYQPRPLSLVPARQISRRLRAARMATGSQETLPPALDSSSEPPSIFDGTTRLYISYTCPYAQRVWITRNCKGLQEQIKLVPIDLKNKPAWYRDKVYPANKVPALEHNNKVTGESLDLIKYIDAHFEGPSLSPTDPAKKEYAEEMFSHVGSFYKTVTSSFKGEGNEVGSAFDYMEAALSKFDDGLFFLGQFSLVDIAYAPFIERFRPFLLEVENCDITLGRPKLAAWVEVAPLSDLFHYLLYSNLLQLLLLRTPSIANGLSLFRCNMQRKWDRPFGTEEMDKLDGYVQTKRDPKELVESYKKRFLLH